MKLLELLVQELPKRGGWPEGYDVVSTNGYGAVWAYKTKGCIAGRELYFHSTTEGHVTREQYEAALAAAPKVKWDNSGYPPVGAECEIRYLHAKNAEWVFFRCVAVDCGVVFGWTGKEPVTLSQTDYQFRPIHSEREKFAELLADKSIMGDNWQMQVVGLKIYDALKADKLGVKLSD